MRRCLAPTALVLALVLFACGGGLPAPPMAPQPATAFAEVPFPPPPARAEVVPDRPPGDVVWIDGAWAWEGSRWRWQKGGWVLPPAGAVYARWEMRRREDGTVLFAPAAWRMRDGAPAASPVVVAAATSGRSQGEPPR